MKECQFYQDTGGELVLNIIKKENYADKDTHAIQKGFQQILRDEFTLTIRFVDQIPRTKRGKYQFLIQKLPIDFVP